MMEQGWARRVAALLLPDPFLLAEPTLVTSSWEENALS